MATLSDMPHQVPRTRTDCPIGRVTASARTAAMGAGGVLYGDAHRDGRWCPQRSEISKEHGAVLIDGQGATGRARAVLVFSAAGYVGRRQREWQAVHPAMKHKRLQFAVGWEK